MKKKPIPPKDAADTRLGDLLAARGYATIPESSVPPADESTLAGQGKLVLRRERKGRGGKTVTLLTGLALPPARMEALARALRKALGCGSSVEGTMIVLQGDIAPRAEEWLRARGAKQVVRGN
ncbi:MAG: translation initiation factor Sui1 [bacterium ADurb.Bin429]|nr:MAG: translation initiation factor Sui1 [bacterium ADurb.Bin429]